MFCKNCGGPLGANDKFCDICGQPVDDNAPKPQAPPSNFGQVPQGDFALPPQDLLNQIPQENSIQSSNTIPVQKPKENSNKPKKKKLVVVLIVTFLVVILLGIALFFMFSDKTGPIVTPDARPTSKLNRARLNVEDYRFFAPKGYSLKRITSGDLFINVSSKTAMYGYVYKSIPFSNYKNLIEKIKTMFEKEGTTIKNYEAKTISNVEFLIFYGTIQNDKETFSFIAAFNSLSDNDTAEYFLYNYTDKAVEDFLNDIVKMAKSVKHIETAESVPKNEKGIALTKPEFVMFDEFKKVSDDTTIKKVTESQ